MSRGYILMADTWYESLYDSQVDQTAVNSLLYASIKISENV